MDRYSVMLVSLACYFAFFAAFVYMIGFVGAFDALPRHVDKGTSGPVLRAVLVDLGLIALFGLQHSIMARPRFKLAWTRIVLPPLERALYCLASALCLIVLYQFWHPIDTIVWSVGNETARTMIWGLFGLGWSIVFFSTLLLNHFELFGLVQAWRYVRKREAPPTRFRTPMLYRWVRHPIYTGFLLAIWSTPDMSAGHLLLAVGFTVYIFIGIAHEERDLTAEFGGSYRDYRTRVGTLIPGLGKRRA